MTNTTTHPPRAVFTLRIAGRPGQVGIHQLRALLKALVRRHDFVCLDAREELEPQPITYTHAFTELRHDVARRTARNSPHHDE